jgi:ribokinase
MAGNANTGSKNNLGGKQMANILVSGLINIETTLKIERFPLQYFPVTYPFFGIRSTVSGVGYNLAKALTHLGNRVNFISLIGNDLNEHIVRNELAQLGIDDRYVSAALHETAQSVILYEESGRRQIHTDLKDNQTQTYPAELFEKAMADSEICALCNINFSRPYLQMARSQGKLVATDVHAIGSLEDDYNHDFMSAADILFMSHENLPCSPREWVQNIWQCFGTPICVVGLGSQGALLGIRSENFLGHFPTVFTRPVVNTIGAGDALFSAFLHSYSATRNPYLSIRKAIVFASHKIGVTGAAEGFLNQSELNDLFVKYQNKINPQL